MKIVSPEDLLDGVVRRCGTTSERRPMVDRILKPATPGDRASALREFYGHALAEIMEQPAHWWGIDPYEVNWPALMSKPEFATWHDIRGCGAILYPFYPVGLAIVSYANPKAKVAIQCDDVLIDVAIEQAREREVAAAGWTFYRRAAGDSFAPDEVFDGERGEYVSNPDFRRWFIRETGRRHGFVQRHD